MTYAEACALYMADGVAQDKAQARSDFAGITDWSKPYARHHYASMCGWGEGGAVNEADTIASYEWAARRRNPEAAWALSWLKLKGIYTPQSNPEALFWLLVARLGQYNEDPTSKLTNQGHLNIALYQHQYLTSTSAPGTNPARMSGAQIDSTVAAWQAFAFQ